MALTKVGGDILQTPLNIGVVTATSGNISGDLEVGGNISCAGTITYEDVTNVDSIGVITARSGIDATGSVSVTGDINVSGVSTFSNVVVGGATTEMVIDGDLRVTGIITVGESSVTINGNTNTISGINSVTDNSGGYLTIPPGAVQFFARDTAPSGWIKANGATISRSTYADLFAGIGTAFGVGDGSTTFTIPDLRGEFPRGWDDGRGIDSGREIGTNQSWAIENITGSLRGVDGANANAYNWGFRPGTIGAISVNQTGTTYNRYGGGYSRTSGSTATFDASRVVNTSSETRPRNISLLACIKY